MAMGEGFWLHSRSGRWLPVYEHLSAIMNDPTAYKLSDIAVRPKRGEQQVEAQFAGTSDEDAGGETLFLLGCAMGQGR